MSNQDDKTTKVAVNEESDTNTVTEKKSYS